MWADQRSHVGAAFQRVGSESEKVPPGSVLGSVRKREVVGFRGSGVCGGSARVLCVCVRRSTFKRISCMTGRQRSF